MNTWHTIQAASGLGVHFIGCAGQELIALIRGGEGKAELLEFIFILPNRFCGSQCRSHRVLSAEKETETTAPRQCWPLARSFPKQCLLAHVHIKTKQNQPTAPACAGLRQARSSPCTTETTEHSLRKGLGAVRLHSSEQKPVPPPQRVPYFQCYPEWPQRNNQCCTLVCICLPTTEVNILQKQMGSSSVSRI